MKHLCCFHDIESGKRHICVAALSHSNSDDWREIMGIFSEIGTFVIALPPYTWSPQWPINNTNKSNKCNRDPLSHIIAFKGLD